MSVEHKSRSAMLRREEYRTFNSSQESCIMLLFLENTLLVQAHGAAGKLFGGDMSSHAAELSSKIKRSVGQCALFSLSKLIIINYRRCNLY